MIIIPSFCNAISNESKLKEKNENDVENSATLFEQIIDKYPSISRICCFCYIRRRKSVGIDDNCYGIKALSVDIESSEIINCQSEFTTVEK